MVPALRRCQFCYSQITVAADIDLFDLVQSRFEQDRDQAKLQGQGSDWFSRSEARLRTYREPEEDLTTCTNTRLSTNFVINSSQHT